MKVEICDSASSDLEAIYLVDEESASIIVSILDEMDNDEELADTLIIHHYRDIQDPAYDVSRFQAFYHKGFNIYRLKCWDYQGSVVPYRVVYAHYRDRIYVLAVVERGKLNYDDKNSEINQRIIRDYGQLGIPTFKLY